MLHVKTHDEDHVNKLRCRYCVWGGGGATPQNKKKKKK